MTRIHISSNRKRDKIGSFVALACGFKSEITAVINGEEINAKSIMKVSVIENTAEIDFIINGEDEKEAADAITSYFAASN